MTNGLHHITAISSDAQRTYDFYTGILGLRFVKKTVNQDATDTYHLYFGDETGAPGSCLTFFPFENAGTGTRGPGLATRIMFSIPRSALGYWASRLQEKGVRHSEIKKKFGLKVIEVHDFDDQLLELVADPESLTVQGDEVWPGVDVPAKNRITGFYGVELSVNDYKTTERLLTKKLGYKLIESSQNIYRYKNTTADRARFIDLFNMSGWPPGRSGAGTVHHVAFRLPDTDSQMQLQAEIAKEGLRPTDQINRFYFKSVYFREPNGCLFELATDEPGFTVDEQKEELGTHLLMAPWDNHKLHMSRANLPHLETDPPDADSDEVDFASLPTEFKHLWVNSAGKADLSSMADTTLIALHGTGADEKDLLPLGRALKSDSNILSLRGNVLEQGMLRFFERHGIGEYDMRSIQSEADKFLKFLPKAEKYYQFTQTHQVLYGFSNGANMILAALMIALSNNEYSKLQLPTTGLIFHGHLPFLPDEEGAPVQTAPDMTGINIFYSGGENDRYFDLEEIHRTKDKLEGWGANVELFTHKGGHGLKPEEVEAAKQFLTSLYS